MAIVRSWREEVMSCRSVCSKRSVHLTKCRFLTLHFLPAFGRLGGLVDIGGGERVVTKSGLMVGLGEEFDEMVETFRILREHEVQILTVGQYLRPTENHLPVVRYWHPDEFDRLRDAALELGFESVASGPLVRSSYHADEAAAEVAARAA